MKLLKVFLFLLCALAITYSVLPFHYKQIIRHNFANVDDYKFFPGKEHAASQHPKPWQLSSSYNVKQPSATSINFMKEHQTCAFLVIRNDTILYEYYGEEYDKSTYSGSFSMAKTVTSLLLGKAIEEGYIKSIDDKITDYVPELDKSAFKDVTIKHLLTMSACIDYDESYVNPFAPAARIYYQKNLKGDFSKIKLRDKPGSYWEYQSICTLLLGEAVRNATKQDLSDYCYNKLWNPMGAEKGFIWSTDDEGGSEKAFCCFNTAARDFARFGKLLLNKGMYDTTRLMPLSYMEQLYIPQEQLKTQDGRTVDWYAYQNWIVHHKGLEIPYYRGILGQLIFAIPERNAVVVRLGKKISNEMDTHETRIDIYNYLDAALEILE